MQHEHETGGDLECLKIYSMMNMANGHHTHLACLKCDDGMCKICTKTSSADESDHDDDDCDNDKIEMFKWV